MATTFPDLGVHDFLTSALTAMSIRLPTEVQAMCIPPILAGRDCIGGAQTGSGKTIAFAVPILQALAKDPFGVFALVLTPTRELAYQLDEQFRALGAPINLQTTVVVGGMDMMSQSLALQRFPHVVIATPGRLVDHLKASGGELNLGKIKFLVLDEADRLLSPSFAPELSAILAEIPLDRQTLLFTATITDAILALQNRKPAKGKEKPFIHVSEKPVMTPALLRQKYVFIPSQVREVYLFHLLSNLCELTGALPPVRRKPEQVSADPRRGVRGGSRRKREDKRKQEGGDEEEKPGMPQTILFVSRCRTAAVLSAMMDELEIPNTPLHSHLSQSSRLASLQEFRRSSTPLLIATDVASRGLDIPTVEVVINYDIPRDPDDYVHRVGRTARAGRGGVAVSFVTEGDVELVKGVEDRIGTQLQDLELPEGPVLESLNKVSIAKRIANMQLHEEGFGKKQEIHKKKADMLRQSGSSAGEQGRRKRRKVAKED